MNAAKSRAISDQSNALVRDVMATIPEQKRNAIMSAVMLCCERPQFMRCVSDEVLNAVSLFAALGLGEQCAQMKNRGDA